MTYKNRVRALENMGATTSDAQAAVDAELEKEGETKMKHTPGPWKIFISGGEKEVIGGEKNNFTATVEGGHYDQRKINAALIAAAPELLSVCKMAADIIQKHTSNEDADAVLATLDDVIAKAEGV